MLTSWPSPGPPGPTTTLAAVRLMGDRDVNQVAVLRDGRFYGLLNRATVIRHLEIRSQLPDAAIARAQDGAAR